MEECVYMKNKKCKFGYRISCIECDEYTRVLIGRKRSKELNVNAILEKLKNI